MVNKSILDNGIRVVTEKIPSVHSVSIGIWVTSGSRHESVEKNGVTHFIEHLMFKGTPTRSALDIAREIDAVGGVLNAFTGREYVCYYAKVLSTHLTMAVNLLADIFLNSKFDSEEIEKERKVILQEINMLEDTPDDFIHDLYCQNFWKEHPLGRPIVGTEESVESLTRDFLLDHKSDTYCADNIIIAAAGNVDHEDLIRLVSVLFKNLVPGKPVAETLHPLHGNGVLHFEKELEQLHLCLGTKALPQNHARRYESYILNAVLGGSMSSRLFQEVREKQGLAYSIYSYVASHSDSGSLVVYAGTSQERMDEVVEIILREMHRLKVDPLTRDELSAAKEQLKGNILLSLESSDNRMSKLAKNEVYFGKYQSLKDIMNSFDQVTAETVQELSCELFSASSLNLVLLGKSGLALPTVSSLIL
ncbi:insulinase family protein [Geobacter pelophilus]|uniref:Insulinase family protein n=1 Tax=Geoanaerobacter pelophilus TaxID=60036 RepID=A0AAW4L4G8_9BACT|nr:pitrilysin family protein [Geoanaerobacter pelophilus]MBT0665788.1 insulinase family protein [Geoanaerobacter pelophilus]